MVSVLTTTNTVESGREVAGSRVTVLWYFQSDDKAEASSSAARSSAGKPRNAKRTNTRPGILIGLTEARDLPLVEPSLPPASVEANFPGQPEGGRVWPR